MLQKYLEQRLEPKPKKSQTESWLMSLQDDIDTLPPLKKARLKLKIQNLIVDAMEDNEYIEFDNSLQESEYHYE